MLRAFLRRCCGVRQVCVFDVRPVSDGSACKAYVLTDKGREIFPAVVSMRQWGER